MVTKRNYSSGSLIQRVPNFNRALIDGDEYSVEFNDANAETLNWQSSRYKGKQLFTTELNKVSTTVVSGSGSVAGNYYAGPVENGGTGSISVPDITGYGNSSCVQKYSRNVYVGNAVIGMDTKGGEDPRLTQYNRFSYVTTNTYFTINSDDSVSINRLSSNESDPGLRRGFYRKFYEDFPMGSNCQLVINDVSIKTNLKDNYNIYFNGGQLFKLLNLAQWNYGTNETAGFPYYNAASTIRYTTASLEAQLSGSHGGILEIIGLGNILWFGFNEYNSDLTRYFYSGSINDSIIDITFSSIERLNLNQANLQEEILNSWIYHRNNSTPKYINDKRIFATFHSQSNENRPTEPGPPLRTTNLNNYPSGSKALRTKNLAELSTTEIVGVNAAVEEYLDDETTIDVLTSTRITCSAEFPLNQNYITADDYLHGGAYFSDLPPYQSYEEIGYPLTPHNFISGSLTFSICDDAMPSILLNLPKNNHLPDGVGQKSFVILPENIHPHIKQNLTYYLAKAGIPLGVDTIPALDNEFKQLR